MNPLGDEWSIQHRAEACALTGRPFAPGENFYTLLFRDGDGFRRQDLSEEAWQQRNENLQPFSFWRARFEPPPAAPPEPLPKENAEELFRRLVAAADRANANACYVLAAMLERKRVLKQIQTEQRRSRSRSDLRARENRGRLRRARPAATPRRAGRCADGSRATSPE